jgi:transposase
MFIRLKKVGPRRYLQLVESRREGDRVKQAVLATLGRYDELIATGRLDGLLRSGARFSEKIALLHAYRDGRVAPLKPRIIGTPMVFERLWKELGIQETILAQLDGRKFEFDVERAIFLTVLHRLSISGSDRAAERWKEGYRIPEAEALELHHLYRAMGWLGEPLEDKEQEAATPFALRCRKDLIEEELFARQRSLFSELDLVFFDTTSIYFEGEGGQSLGEWGHSKDHRPDLRQMVVGVVLDGSGRPICCELWPGNTTDVTRLLPIVDRLRQRFAIGSICIVADRGMISKETIAELEDPGRRWQYILGARMRTQKEVREEVLGRAGRYQVVQPPREAAKDPAPLEVKEVWVEERRYVVCRNEDQARKDAADRQAIVASLRERLHRGDKSLVGNKGYRLYLKSRGEGFAIDEEKIEQQARYDGKWVLRTNTELAAEDVALKYKQLWMVEQAFRTLKSILETRPIYHKRDETIRGHVFCSFLALLLMKELQDRLARRGLEAEWDQVIGDLDRLTENELELDGKRFLWRSESRGECTKAFQAAGVALPPTIRQVEAE